MDQTGVNATAAPLSATLQTADHGADVRAVAASRQESSPAALAGAGAPAALTESSDSLAIQSLTSTIELSPLEADANVAAAGRTMGFTTPHVGGSGAASVRGGAASSAASATPSSPAALNSPEDGQVEQLTPAELMRRRKLLVSLTVGGGTHCPASPQPCQLQPCRQQS